MDLQSLKDVLSNYGNILIIKEGAVFSLLMKGVNLSNMKKLQEIQSTVLDYTCERYPVIEVFRNDDHYLCMVLKPHAESAIQLIANERQRQIEVEGWTPEHDDKHTDGSLALAAASYAVAEDQRINYKDFTPPSFWPDSWNNNWFKPSPDDRVRELVKAGALIVAEIERLQRNNS